MDRAERRSRTRNFIEAQLRIARQRATPQGVIQAGRFKKQHAMDCGRPQCMLCGNPRKAGQKNVETMQELRARDRLIQGLSEVFSGSDEESFA